MDLSRMVKSSFRVTSSEMKCPAHDLYNDKKKKKKEKEKERIRNMLNGDMNEDGCLEERAAGSQRVKTIY